MSHGTIKKIAIASSFALTGLVGSAEAADGIVLSTNASWKPGAAATLYADPPEARVGIGTSLPKAGLHIDSPYDANLSSPDATTALRVTSDVSDGQEMLLVDSNEITAGKWVVPDSAIPHMALSRLHLQHDGGELLLHGAQSYWTLFSAGSISTGGPVHVRSSSDAAAIGGGPLMLGPNSANLALDGNEIMARANGAPSVLHLNAEGGSVILHGHGAMPESARVTFFDDGRVRIGASNSSYGGSAKLSVDGLVVAQELRVTPDGWADHVFSPGYTLRTATELERYVRQHRHLPGIPSEQSVMKEGLPVARFSTELLRNVEELTLRVIEQSKQLASQRQRHEQELAKLEQRYEARLARLEARLLGAAAK